jgi:integrase
MNTRTNKFGVPRLCAYKSSGGFRYYWKPSKTAFRTGKFRHVSLGADLTLNRKHQMFCARLNSKPCLAVVRPNSVAHLFRLFGASPKYARYSRRWQQDAHWIFRRLEVIELDGRRLFGNITIARVTRQMAYTLYEICITNHGIESANKMTTACRAAFQYAALRPPGIFENPFSRLGKMTPPSRRQYWTPEQFDLFIKMADWLGYPAIGRCALLCMELMQRPGDMLSLKWGAFDERRNTWFIRQTKRGTEVFIPPTICLMRALDAARKAVMTKAPGGDIADLFICATPTCKRWHRRNFTKAVRLIARAAGIPDDLQMRDLRRTAATEAASAGATPAELMAVGGWQNQNSIRLYLLQTAEQAASCQAKRESYRVKHSAMRSRT